MLNKESYRFITFVGWRVAEIQQNQPKNWKHVSSQDNKVTDILMRGAPPSLLGPESEWQQGPEWLSLLKDQWPVNVRTEYEPGQSNDLTEFFWTIKCLTSMTSVLSSLGMTWRKRRKSSGKTEA